MIALETNFFLHGYDFKLLELGRRFQIRELYDLHPCSVQRYDTFFWHKNISFLTIMSLAPLPPNEWILWSIFFLYDKFLVWRSLGKFAGPCCGEGGNLREKENNLSVHNDFSFQSRRKDGMGCKKCAGRQKAWRKSIPSSFFHAPPLTVSSAIQSEPFCRARRQRNTCFFFLWLNICHVQKIQENWRS